MGALPLCQGLPQSVRLRLTRAGGGASQLRTWLARPRHQVRLRCTSRDACPPLASSALTVLTRCRESAAAMPFSMGRPGRRSICLWQERPGAGFIPVPARIILFGNSNAARRDVRWALRPPRSTNDVYNLLSQTGR